MMAPRLTQAQVTAPEISQFKIERMTDGVYLSALIRFDLPPTVEDALLKGVPVYFVTEAEVLRDRWYWMDKKVALAQRQFRLAYLPLTRRWRLSVVSGAQASNSGVALSQNFEALPEALTALQRLSRWKIAEITEVEVGVRHNVEFRFRLDVTQLPRPFQIGALGQSDWNLSVTANQRLATEPER